MKEKTSKTFEKSLERFAKIAKMILRIDDHLKDDRYVKESKECQKIRLSSLLNQFRFESIDFLMREVSPETRKEIMDCAWNGVFERDSVSSGKYLIDWFNSDGSMTT